MSASLQHKASQKRTQMRFALYAYSLVLAAAVGCAQGYPSAPERMIEPPSPPEPPVFTGEACESGDRVPCECAGGKGMGVRACVPSETSPTKGMLSECVACTEFSSSNASAGASARTGSMSSAQTASSTQAGRKADAGRSGASAGSAGQAGSAGKSAARAGQGGGSSSGGSVAAGSGGQSGAGGTGGSAGRAGAGGARAGAGGGAAAGSGGRGERCNCNTGCLLIGVFPCCRSDGSCGCTWAPGAYCD